MVALLVLATFVAFIGIDVLLHREKYRFRVAESHASPKVAATAVPVVGGVALPEALAYHPGHAWAMDQGNGRVRVGLDELAAALIGPVSRVETPQRGRWLRQGEKGWTIHTERGDAPMLAPAEGEIVAVNEKAIANPELVSGDPYGSGWLLEIYSPDIQVSFRNLMSGGLAAKWMEWSTAQLRQAISPNAFATAQDGGRIDPRVAFDLPPEKWRELAQRFFRL